MSELPTEGNYSSDPAKKPWIKRGATAVLGAPLTATVAIWGYATFVQKDDANARFRDSKQEIRVIREEVKAVRADVNTQIYQQFQLMQNQLEGVRTEQRETNKRIDRMLNKISED